MCRFTPEVMQKFISKLESTKKNVEYDTIYDLHSIHFPSKKQAEKRHTKIYFVRFRLLFIYHFNTILVFFGK